MKRILAPIILLLVAVAIYRSQQPPQARAKLSYSGVVEVTSVDEAFEITGTLKSVEVREGQSVRRGDLLARLDDAAALTTLEQARSREGQAKARLQQLLNGSRGADIAQAEARLAQSQADLEQLRNGPTQQELAAAQAGMRAARERAELSRSFRSEEVAGARSQWEGARSNLKTARSDLDRFQKLHREGAISDQQLEQHQNSYQQALSGYKVAQENLHKLESGPRQGEARASFQDYRSSQARYADLAKGTRPELIAKAEAIVTERAQALRLMREGPRPEEIEAARQTLREAKAGVSAAEVALAKSRLKASCDGVVLLRNLEPGETAQAGAAVISIGDLEHPWVNIYVPEYELPKVRLGQSARVSADGQSQPLQGKVTRVYEKAEYTPKFIQTPRERVNLVFRAKVEFANPEQRLRSGMPADVELTP